MKLKTRLADLLKAVGEQKTTVERVKVLRENDSDPLRIILKCCFDPQIVFNLPEGPVPYKPTDLTDLDSVLFREVRKMYIFVKNGNSLIFGLPDNPNIENMPKVKREKLFIDMMEGMAPADAALLEAIKDKKMPFKGVTRKAVIQAFPGLISNEQDV